MSIRIRSAAVTAALTLAATAAHAATDTVTNPYGLEALWKGGDFIARGTLLILIIMSMGSWYIIVAKLLEQARVLRRAKAAENSFWKAATLTEGARQLDEGSPFRFIAQSGLSAREHHDGALLEQVDLNTWVAVAVERATNAISNRLQDGLAFLGTVGSTAPFIGLFGTVWGIYHALTAIGIAGQASIDKVAGPVGEALIMTAIGLAVAVPAVLGYNWLVRRNKAVMERVRSFSAELHTVILTGRTTAAAVVSTKSASVARVG
ncbi:MotA/TolQ/ExbB proton channel family protein [Pandoraea bronchicola]|uniref:Biopolymer transport protein ExbB n=1 Tax=Pandoraea bronchicola TaxID=2508287 RepID=A0A5E5BNC8_9BURK|nr:MotA/TolQ/ExbB proton channel family protein [Pandoraea bronchicola]VVE86868.1 Biopolymer transport protein ExbB [Pandoraea bronchicola]